MSTGFATAFSEITLVLFTTLAPSGAVAYALMSFPIIRGRLSDDAHRRIDKALCIPLIVSLVGLVASATHLGNPANVLYVFMGWGEARFPTRCSAPSYSSRFQACTGSTRSP